MEGLGWLWVHYFPLHNGMFLNQLVRVNGIFVPFGSNFIIFLWSAYQLGLLSIFEINLANYWRLNIMEGRVWRHFLCVRVLVDISQPLLIGIWVPRPNKSDLWVTIKYERLQSFSYKCVLDYFFLKHQVQVYTIEAIY